MTPSVQLKSENGLNSQALLDLVKPEWRQAFLQFVQTGDADEKFLDYLNGDEKGRQAVEEAFSQQAKAFEGLAAELKQSSDVGTVPPRSPGVSGIPDRIAATLQVALETPVEQRRQVMEEKASELAASMAPAQRAVLLEIVRSLDDMLSKTAG
jgi:hypothetical protein